MIVNPYSFGGSAPASVLPSIADNNDSFNDEGAATTGWTATNATLATSGGYLRETKSGAGSSSMAKAMTFTPTDQDYILYGKARASTGTNHIGVIWFLNGSKEVSIWFGSATADTSYAGGNVSICGTTGASTRNVANAQGGLSYDTTAVEFALHFDKKWGRLNCFFLESGKWRFKCRVACDWFTSTEIAVLNTSATPTGGWCEFDHLTLCKPNIMAIGDSICQGKTLFSPDPADALTNNTNSWQYHCQIYQSLRNNLIVNKGVGSNTSADIASRVVADCMDHDPRVVFVHASSNDQRVASQSTRTTNVQNTVNSITGAGGAAVILNAMYGTSAYAGQPTLRDYMFDWWDNYAPTVTGQAGNINAMHPLLSGGYMDGALTESDEIHPTASGYQLIGQFIAAS
jgi:lysophospholipase L1-like esterase